MLAREKLLIQIHGRDFPGIFAAVTALLQQHEAQITDIQQISMLGRLSLVLLIELPVSQVLPLLRSLKQFCSLNSLQLDFEPTEEKMSLGSQYALTILSSKLRAESLSALGSALAEKEINIERMYFLARSNLECLEMTVRGKVSLAEIRKVVFAIATAHEFDAAIQAENLFRRSKRLIVMDMDSTLIQQEVIDEIADLAGVKQQVAQITERAMRGELDFNQALTERVALLKGVSLQDLANVLKRISLTPGARELIKVLKKMGFKIAIISGGFTYFAEHFRKELDLDAAYANQLEIKDGQLTGRVVGEIVNRARKAQILREWAAKEKVPLEQTVAVGDGANDLDMLAIAGLGVAFNAKPLVREQSQAFINQAGLDVILYLLGLSEQEKKNMLEEKEEKEVS